MTSQTGSERRPRVALETTLLVHGVPSAEGPSLARRLSEIVRARGAEPAVVGVVDGAPIAGLSDGQLEELLRRGRERPGSVAKVNTSNLGAALFRGQTAATTVSTTMEIASRAGIGVFATGGLGGVHRSAIGGGPGWDVSSDLVALTRFPMCVVASGVKSILDVPATREVLETLGVPVIGFRTDDFPVFYMRRHPTEHVNACDARFDDADELARFVRFELARTNRGVLVVNPIPGEHEISAADWARWLAAAEARAQGDGTAKGRDATPRVLAALHEVSAGATLRSNIELVANNADLAAQIAVGMVRPG